jgi:glycosyltransferase involved in cell wall biosynthesis
MRIAVWHNLPSGGGKRALHSHVRGLVARGHHVEVWCPPTADRAYLPLSKLAPEHVVPLERNPQATWNDIWMYRTHAEREVRAAEAHCRAVADAVARGGFDVLFANSCMFFATSPIGAMAGVPSALYLQEPVRWLYEAMPRQAWLAPPAPDRPIMHPRRWTAALDDWRRLTDTRIRAREERRFAEGFDRILVNSLFSRESVLRAYGVDAQVCYLGADTSAFADLGLDREDFLVGLGALTPPKNARLAIEALGRVPAPRPRLVWIGNMSSTAYVREMQALAAARGVALDLRIGIGDRELVETLNRAMALVYAPRLEPFGLAPIEAAACATPAIAVAEGGIRETVIDRVTGLLVPGDADSFAAAIVQLRDDPALARRLGAAARRNAVERWSEDGAIDRIEQALARVAAQPSPSNSAVVM